MTRSCHNNHLAKKTFRIIRTGFEDYCNAFATITQRASLRFEQCDWAGMRSDTVERLDLYPRIVDETSGLLHRELGQDIHCKALWPTVKSLFAKAIENRENAEIASTFFNSVHRKIFSAIGVDPLLTFIDPMAQKALKETPDLYFTMPIDGVTPALVSTIIRRYPFKTPFAHLEEDARLCAIRIGHITDGINHQGGDLRIDMLKTPFFRGMSAYLVGRLRWADGHRPIVFALDNETNGIRIDALLTTPAEMRILFSFSRAYFHVKIPSPGAVVAFLSQLIPERRMAELYISLGYHKHGKTELYRDLLRHQKICSLDQFDFSPGKHGMVMIAFNMPKDDLIYKLIRDRFDSPKRTSFQQVMQKYDYVFKHDRAGRLLDVQTFENLILEDCCFTAELLSVIREEATKAATVKDGFVVFHHTYVERRVTPLDVYLDTASAQDARTVIIDYGRAIKDLARMNVFPGDMLIKNFGVTRLGRVVFYDYDELCPLLDCNFRKLPQAKHYEDELSSEPWFSVGENDVFPEEFSAFLGLSSELRQVFFKYHKDLLDTEFWLKTQAQIRAGTWTHIRPYKKRQQLRPSARYRKGQNDA